MFFFIIIVLRLGSVLWKWERNQNQKNPISFEGMENVRCKERFVEEEKIWGGGGSKKRMTSEFIISVHWNFLERENNEIMSVLER